MQTKLMKIQPDIDKVEIVSTDDGGCIAAQYQDFGQVISKVQARTIPLHKITDHVIDLGPVYIPPYKRIYNLSQFTLKTLPVNIETNLPHSFIQGLSSLATALMVFTMKKEG